MDTHHTTGELNELEAQLNEKLFSPTGKLKNEINYIKYVYGKKIKNLKSNVRCLNNFFEQLCERTLQSLLKSASTIVSMGSAFFFQNNIFIRICLMKKFGQILWNMGGEGSTNKIL